MNMKQLETFYWIERLGSFGAAAEHVFATQSTVSMRIAELEGSLGVKLFDRSRRSARLTPKGKELVPYVEQVMEVVAEMQRRVSPAQSRSGLVRVGVVDVIAVTWLPQFIRALQAECPNISLEVEVALSFELTEKLRTGGLDVVFAMGSPPGTNYVAEPLGAVDLEWMAHPGLDIPVGRVHPKVLQPWPFITLNRQSYHHATVESWLRENQVRARRVVVCNSMTVAAALVSAGIGISLLPPICYRREINEGFLRIVQTTRKLAPVKLFAMYAFDEFQPLAPLVTALAARVSKSQAPDETAIRARPRAKRPSRARVRSHAVSTPA